MKSMVILIDTNIILDVIARREPFVAESRKVLELCARQEIKGYIAFHSISNIFFILRKKFSNEERRLLLRGILKILKVTGASHERVMAALEQEDFEDFEDCLQEKCAEEVEAECIITRNVGDYGSSAIQAENPHDFLQRHGYI